MWLQMERGHVTPDRARSTTMVSAFFDACVLKFEVDILACCCLRKSPPISNGFLIRNQWHDMGARQSTSFERSFGKSIIYICMNLPKNISQIALKGTVYIYIQYIKYYIKP